MKLIHYHHLQNLKKLIEYHHFKRSLVRFIPNKYLEIGLRTIYNIEQQISKYLRGQILAASSVAILSIIGLFILNKVGANITLVIFIGIIAGLANLIPMVGPFIGMVPAILITIMNNVGNESAFSHYIFNIIHTFYRIEGTTYKWVDHYIIGQNRVVLSNRRTYKRGQFITRIIY